MSDQSPFNQTEMPFNALPPAVIALALLIGGIELLFQIGSYGIIGGPEAIGWRVAAMEDFGFFNSVFEAMRDQNTWPLEHVIRFLSYSVIHVSFVQVLMAIVFILALGKMVGDVFGNLAFIAVFAVATIVGALAFGLFLNSSVPLLGAYPGAYGLIGAYTFILWIGLGAMHENQMRAFSLIGFLLAIQLIWALFFGSDPTWVAEIAGFVVGFVVSPLLVPGAFPRILAKLRKR
ncbi:membrane associated rhomboid family serine protease [Pacificibacter maritimus]|uniref:Membrane associated rhomboid family serine protease n=1 Tax=Pacificibacter maritimus TaxID=762213 RepID=A0A3N4U962_9RHOB|nr:rhomboid family intramembrane serine protease [Pacificibacter maritimus]RPE67276.1 membrane associated rhomboid family serine protease [Pacificibacter maritimus]